MINRCEAYAWLEKELREGVGDKLRDYEVICIKSR